MNHAPPVQKTPSQAKSGPLRPPAGPLVARHPGPISPMLRRGACACGGTCPRCLSRSSLSIGPVDDPLEREADAMADRIMGLPGRPLPAATSWARPARQRNSVACEAAGDGLDIQAKSEPDSQSGDPAPVGVERVLAKPGHPLDDASRTFYEPRLGRDLSDVRVHTDADAARSAREVGALAYTVGADVVFASGRYAPQQPVGRRLLAHELAHVAQSDSSVLRRSVDESAGGLEPASLEHTCDPTDDENFPMLKRGDIRNAVGVAQVDLNRILPDIAACLINPGCMASYSPKAQNFMAEQMSMLSKMPIDEDCRFGLDTLHATYAAQAFFFKNPADWDGIIGPETWRAIDELARSPLGQPEPSPLLWDFILPPQPPRPPVFL